MTDPSPHRERLNEIEALVRDARGYCDVSEDLRPRILEDVRIARRLRIVEGCFACIAASIMIVAISVAAVDKGNGPGEKWLVRIEADSAVPSNAATDSKPPADVNWALVEAFCELRQRQSRAIGCTF